MFQSREVCSRQKTSNMLVGNMNHISQYAKHHHKDGKILLSPLLGPNSVNVSRFLDQWEGLGAHHVLH